MNEMIERGLVAMELKTPYSPVIHNPKAIANYQHLDGKFCSAKFEDQVKSALIILLDMKQGVN